MANPDTTPPVSDIREALGKTSERQDFVRPMGAYRRDEETGRGSWDDDVLGESANDHVARARLSYLQRRYVERSQSLVIAVQQLAEARQIIQDYQQDVDRYGFLFERARSVTFNEDDSVTLTYQDGSMVGLAGGDTLDDAVDCARRQVGDV
jgi:hypothetical protein